jgi:hypothetical protein
MNQDLTRVILISVLSLSACGPADRNTGDGDGGAGDAFPGETSCVTAITGKVFAPNGTLPLYNVTVYVPGTDPPPFTPGVQCSKCGEIPGGALAKAVSDPEGNFRLEGVPAGVGIPIVITTGKWRRRLTLPPVGECVDTAIPDGMFRLPRNRSEGELPKIAVATGGCDPLGCILPKLGIAAGEFGDKVNDPQAVTFYNGAGGLAPGTPQSAESLWSSLSELKKFDIVINSCECNVHDENKIAPDVLRQYADLGGRVFGSHYQYTWTKTLIPEWRSTATWTGGSTSTPDLVDTSHADGMALAQWLVAVGASGTLGQISLGDKIPNASTVNPPTKRWLYSSGSPATTHYLSFNTPVGAIPDNQCGKVVYAGMHVASGTVNASFPSGCSSSLSPDEKALIFLLFDLGSCTDIIF